MLKKAKPATYTVVKWTAEAEEWLEMFIAWLQVPKKSFDHYQLEWPLTFKLHQITHTHTYKSPKCAFFIKIHESFLWQRKNIEISPISQC